MNEVSEKIAKILEDPESIRMISEIAGNFMGASSESKQDAESEEKNAAEKETVKETEVETLPALTPISLSGLGSTVEKLLDGADIENTVRLVTALKPYMSTRRRESAEAVLRVLSIIKLVGNSNFAEMAKLLGK